MGDKHKEWFDGIEDVVKDPLRFKAKLAIGEDAYTSLRLKNVVIEAWDAVGAGATAAGIAKSSVVATTFFSPTGFLAAIGLGGVAATPVGWVAVAGIMTGTTWLGITHYMKKMTTSRVTVVPDFINTPLDVLALGLFDLLTPLALKVAEIDGSIREEEKERIRTYFVEEWGYDHKFVDEGMKFTETRLSEFTIKEIAKTLANFKKENPDCNYDAMSKGIIQFLQEIVEADEVIDEREEMAVERVRNIFEETGRFSLKKTARSCLAAVGGSANRLIRRFKKNPPLDKTC